MAETFYSVLGVDPEADTETIQSAYRELVKTHHPDVSDEDDAATQFKRITQARDILVDESSRKQYDRVGHNTYVRRYMDGNAWTVEHGSSSQRTNTGASSRSNTGSTSNATGTNDQSSQSSNRQSSSASSSRSRSGSRRSEGTNRSETAHDYDRYRSHYAADETHGSRNQNSQWQDRSWTEDFDWSPDGDDTSTAGAGGPSTENRARADGWQSAQAAASGYTPSGRDPTGAASDSGTSVGTIQPALRDIGPWLVFHFVFLISAFVTILLLMSWEASVPTVFISLILLGGAVFFSVLHMVSRIYS